MPYAKLYSFESTYSILVKKYARYSSILLFLFSSLPCLQVIRLAAVTNNNRTVSVVGSKNTFAQKNFGKNVGKLPKNPNNHMTNHAMTASVCCVYIFMLLICLFQLCHRWFPLQRRHRNVQVKDRQVCSILSLPYLPT